MNFSRIDLSLAACVLAIVTFPAVARSGSEVTEEIDKIVAVLDQQPILRSDLEIEARVALIQQGGVAAADVAVLDQEVLARTLEHVINQRLIGREADRLQVFRLEDEARRHAYEAFVRKLGGEALFQAFLNRHEISAHRIVVILERELRVTQFLANKVGLGARVAEIDARKYFEAHPERFHGTVFSDVQESIVAMLTRERVMTLTRQFLDALRSRAELRILMPLEEGRAASAQNASSSSDAAAQKR